MELGGIFFLLLIFFLSRDTKVFHYVGRRPLLLRKHVHAALHCCVIHPSIHPSFSITASSSTHGYLCLGTEISWSYRLNC